VCPPRRTDPLDTTDPMQELRCNSECAEFCIGGQGEICGETQVLGQDRNVFAKICTCHCPAAELGKCRKSFTSKHVLILPVIRTFLLSFFGMWFYYVVLFEIKLFGVLAYVASLALHSVESDFSVSSAEQ
jgi:hypothetical protein